MLEYSKYEIIIKGFLKFTFFDVLYLKSPDGKAHEWPLYDLENKEVMVVDEFNIHQKKESKRKILDWERVYFLRN